MQEQKEGSDEAGRWSEKMKTILQSGGWEERLGIHELLL